MKKNLFALFAVALAVLASAFTYMPAPEASTVDYIWFSDIAATNVVTPLEDPITEDANNCDGEGEVCEYGYLPSDFNEPGQPESGLREGHEDPFILEKE